MFTNLSLALLYTRRGVLSANGYVNQTLQLLTGIGPSATVLHPGRLIYISNVKRAVNYRLTPQRYNPTARALANAFVR